MKIVVPTDFSANAKIACAYAVAFARQAQAEIILLHVLPSIGPTLGRTPTTMLMQEILQWTDKEFAHLQAEIKAQDLQVSHQVAYGAGVEYVIEPYIETHAIDLIIMGSKGASGLKKILLGSNTVGVINNCSIPVIVVPEHALPSRITHLVYASDLKAIMEEVKRLIPYAQLLQAAIKIIHMPPLQYLEHLDTERLIHNLRTETGYQEIEVVLMEGQDIVHTIEQYAAASHGELLVMYTHHTSFLEQLFSQSITREIAWHNQVPLFVIKSR